MRCVLASILALGIVSGITLMSCTEQQRRVAVSGVVDGAGDAPVTPPEPTGDFGGHAVSFLTYLAAYAAGSLGKGFIRGKLGKAEAQ